MCYRTARAGADIVKEDHGLSNQDAAPFRERVTACVAAVARANKERAEEGDPARAIYLANIGGHGDRFGFSQEQWLQIMARCKDNEGLGRTILPSPGGGTSISCLPDMKALYGADCVYLLGGSLLKYGEQIGDAIRMRRAALEN